MDDLGIAKQLISVGRFSEALKALGEAKSVRSASNALDTLRVLLYARLGRYSQSRELADRLSKGKHLNPTERSICQYSIGLVDWDEGFTDRAIEHLQKSVLLAKQGDDLERLCWAQLCLWAMLANRHEVEAAGPLFAEARMNAARLGNAQVLSLLHIYVAEAEGKRGLISSAQAHSRTALNLLDTQPNIWLEAWAEHILLGLALISGDLDSGIAHGDRALRLAEQAGVATTYRACLGNYGNFLYATGRFDEAVEYFRRAITTLPASGDNASGAIEAIASIRLAQGRIAEASELLDGIEKSNQNPKDRALYVSRHTQLLRIRLLIDEGKWQQALGQVIGLLRVARQCEDQLLEAMASLTRAEILLHTDNPLECLQSLEEIAPSLLVLPPNVHGHYEAILSSAFAQSGDQHSATLHYRRASRVFSSIHNVPALVELNRRLANLSQLPSADSAAITNSSISGKTTLQAAAALVLQVGNPEFLAREIMHLLYATECVSYASVISTSNSEEVVETIGHPTGNVCKRLSIGCAHGRHFDVAAEINVDGESAATMSAVNILLSGIHALERARSEREERLKLWPPDDSPLEDDGAVITGQMRNLMLLARKVARTNVSVLLTGESGTGKEILARAIHTNSARADKPFIPFNCTAVPREMLESQLFGHRRGAFTSADRDNPGLIRAAKGGTLFLDEIGELGLDLQPKLLRFLESGEICPLGEPSPLTVDVRIIAATNRNLEQLVQDGHFREDLFYRLHVIPLAIPPLRERRDEIPALVHHFVARAASEFSKGRLQIAEETMEHFLLHPWPGNVRQLQNEVRRMVALAESDSVLTPASLSPEMHRATPRPSPRNNGSLELAVPLTDKLMPTLSRIEREMIRAALRANQGRLAAAAKALGISRKGLYLKRQRLGL